MGKALYRKYRSTSLNEIIGQEHITDTLQNALRQNRVSHAYLLTGPRGVGKTSIARILAHEVNGLAYSEEQHLDIIEIDAASNRRIDEMRDLRDRIHTAPASAKYKVYIIDEVHMLTKEAFNALLKTLEEPPAHVIFILATTEAHKLPDTIVSRTQRYSFRPIPAVQVSEHLRTIANKEKIGISDEALSLIAEHGGGSFRDSISLLDQVSSITDDVSADDVRRLLGRVPSEQIRHLIDDITAGQAAAVVEGLHALHAAGYEAGMIASQLSATLRDLLLNDSAPAGPTVRLLSGLLAVPGAYDPVQQLEITVLEATFVNGKAGELTPLSREKAAKADAPSLAQKPKPARIETVASTMTMVPKDAATSEPVTKPSAPDPSKTDQEAKADEQDETAGQMAGADASDLWHEVLQEIKQQYNTLYGIARMATPTLDGDILTLQLKFAFHLKRIQEAKNRKILTTCVDKLRGRPTDIKCVIAEKTTDTDAPSGKDPVSTVSNIFGGAELL